MKQFQFTASTTIIQLCNSNNANISSIHCENLNLLPSPIAVDLYFHRQTFMLLKAGPRKIFRFQLVRSIKKKVADLYSTTHRGDRVLELSYKPNFKNNYSELNAWSQ